MAVLTLNASLRKKLLFAFIFSTLLTFPLDLWAIHAIFKGAAPIARAQGSLKLGMSLATFLQTVKGAEVSPAIGQFSDEHRFEIDRSGSPDDVTLILSDFYQDRLFRIEINYQPRPKSSSDIQALITANSEKHGPPRINILPGVRLIFWDDGATRMIMQVDENGDSLSYSLTYIDDDLFHKASRDRVQRETGGRSKYGK